MTKRRASLMFVSAVMLVLAAGCHKKTVPPPPPSTPPPVAPVANQPVINFFTAEPSYHQRRTIFVSALVRHRRDQYPDR